MKPLPLPAFVMHPLTAVSIAALHVYLAAGHLTNLFGGSIRWTEIWKGFGALSGAYVFAALASRRLAGSAWTRGDPEAASRCTQTMPLIK